VHSLVSRQSTADSRYLEECFAPIRFLSFRPVRPHFRVDFLASETTALPLSTVHVQLTYSQLDARVASRFVSKGLSLSSRQLFRFAGADPAISPLLTRSQPVLLDNRYGRPQSAISSPLGYDRCSNSSWSVAQTSVSRERHDIPAPVPNIRHYNSSTRELVSFRSTCRCKHDSPTRNCLEPFHSAPPFQLSNSFCELSNERDIESRTTSYEF